MKQKFFIPVCYVTREDIEDTGFNSDISDEKLTAIANKMGDYLSEYYRDALHSACQLYSLEEL